MRGISPDAPGCLAFADYFDYSDHMKIYSAKDARLKMRAILDCAYAGEPVAIRRNGRIDGFVVPTDWYLFALSYISAGAPNCDEAKLRAEARAIVKQGKQEGEDDAADD